MSRSSDIAATLEPPYYAVIFTSVRTEIDAGYEDTAARMEELAITQPGFLGVEAVRENGFGITVSYWSTEEAILQWRENLEHRDAQRGGQRAWYELYKVRVARVERDYGFCKAVPPEAPTAADPPG